MSPTAAKKPLVADPIEAVTPELQAAIDEIAELLRETYCAFEGGLLAKHAANSPWSSLTDERKGKWRAMSAAVHDFVADQ